MLRSNPSEIGHAVDNRPCPRLDSLKPVGGFCCPSGVPAPASVAGGHEVFLDIGSPNCPGVVD